MGDRKEVSRLPPHSSQSVPQRTNLEPTSQPGSRGRLLYQTLSSYHPFPLGGVPTSRTSTRQGRSSCMLKVSPRHRHPVAKPVFVNNYFRALDTLHEGEWPRLAHRVLVLYRTEAKKIASPEQSVDSREFPWQAPKSLLSRLQAQCFAFSRS